jgi:hypothetical protein
MKLAIMQPYFFPYLGYFQLINSVDRFIFFDDVQYIRHGWINRNRILKPAEGWQFIIMPLQKHKQVELIKDVKLVPDPDWKQKILRQLEHYRKKARYYSEVVQLLNDCFNTSETNIAKFNARCIELVFQYLQVPFRAEISSEMNFNYSNVGDAGEWALRICEQLKAGEYVNPPGGMELFDPGKFQNANIKLTFLPPVLTPYDQKRATFEAGLSIIDVLMFNGAENTRKMIDVSDK